MKLRHRMIGPGQLITVLDGWHDALVSDGGYLTCDCKSDQEGHGIAVTGDCDFVAGYVEGANGESYTVVPVPGIVQLPPAPGEQCAWELHTPKFAIAVFPQEGDADLFEGFASFGDALRFVAGIAPDQRSHWPLVIDAEVSHWLGRGVVTDVEWPDDSR